MGKKTKKSRKGKEKTQKKTTKAEEKKDRRKKNKMSIQKEEAKKKEVPVAFSDCDEIYFKIVDGQYVLIRHPPSEFSNQNKVQDPKGNEWTVYSCDSMIDPRQIAMEKYLAGEVSEEDYLKLLMEECIDEVDG